MPSLRPKYPIPRRDDSSASISSREGNSSLSFVRTNPYPLNPTVILTLTLEPNSNPAGLQDILLPGRWRLRFNFPLLEEPFVCNVNLTPVPHVLNGYMATLNDHSPLPLTQAPFSSTQSSVMAISHFGAAALLIKFATPLSSPMLIFSSGSAPPTSSSSRPSSGRLSRPASLHSPTRLFLV